MEKPREPHRKHLALITLPRQRPRLEAAKRYLSYRRPWCNHCSWLNPYSLPGRAGGDPYADAQDHLGTVGCVNSIHSFLNLECRVHGASHMIIVLDGYVEESHNGVAEQAIHDPVVGQNDFRAELEKFFRNRSHLFDPQLLSQPRVAPTIGKQDCDLREAPRLPMERSPVAEIGIRIAASYTPEPPHESHEPSEGHTVHQALRR
jgi:hypothetical protein